MNKKPDIEKLNALFNLASTELDKEVFDVVPIKDNSLSTTEQMSDDDNEIISLKTMKEDYLFIKESIKDNVIVGQNILSKINTEEAISDPEMIESISSLIKNINSSLKDLSRIYKDIKEIEKGRTKTIEVAKEVPGQVNNIIVTGTLDEILAKF